MRRAGTLFNFMATLHISYILIFGCYYYPVTSDSVTYTYSLYDGSVEHLHILYVPKNIKFHATIRISLIHFAISFGMAYVCMLFSEIASGRHSKNRHSHDRKTNVN